MTRAKRKVTAPEKPAYVAPKLDAWQRKAMRDWCNARYRKALPHHKPVDHDPLWLRMGMRAGFIEQRAGWAISNPRLDGILRRHPEIDESLGGIEWLRAIYRKERDLVCLPGVLRFVNQRIECGHAVAWPGSDKSSEPQGRPAPPQPAAELGETMNLFAYQEKG